MNTLAEHDTYIKYIVRHLDIISDSQADPVSFLEFLDSGGQVSSDRKWTK